MNQYTTPGQSVSEDGTTGKSRNDSIRTAVRRDRPRRGTPRPQTRHSRTEHVPGTTYSEGYSRPSSGNLKRSEGPSQRTPLGQTSRHSLTHVPVSPTRTQESGVDARPCSTPCRTAPRMLQYTRPSRKDAGAITKLIKIDSPRALRTRKPMVAPHPDSGR